MRRSILRCTKRLGAASRIVTTKYNNNVVRLPYLISSNTTIQFTFAEYEQPKLNLRLFHNSVKDYFAQRKESLSQQTYQGPPPQYQQQQHQVIPPNNTNTTNTNHGPSNLEWERGLAMFDNLVKDVGVVKTTWLAERPGWFRKFLSAVVNMVILLFFGLLLYQVIRSMFKGEKSGGLGDLIGLNTNIKKSNNQKATFADVRGIDEVKNEVSEIVEYLRRPAQFEKMGAKLPKGILLAGPPGTGKTLLARAMAGEAGVPFYYTTAAEFDELFVGVGAARIRKLFEEAQKTAPSIVFIDELDSIGNRQNPMMNHSGTINQLLSVLDGFEKGSQVLVMGATNFADRIDPALIRPGRFDKVITVPLPDMKGRTEIAEYYIEKVQSAPDVKPKDIAAGTPGFSGADIENLINRAAIKATLKGLPKMDSLCVEEAKDDITMGVARPSLMLTEEEKRLVAYHESGHTLVNYFTDGKTRLHKVTVLPRGQSLGSTHGVQKDDSTLITKKQFLAQLAQLLGGKAAEELIFGMEGITTGPASDLKGATDLATKLIGQCGMGETYGNSAYGPQDTQSDAGKRQLEVEVSKLLTERYNFAKQLLTKHKKELDLLAAALIEHETLDREEIIAVVEGRTVKDAKWGKKKAVPSTPITIVPEGIPGQAGTRIKM